MEVVKIPITLRNKKVQHECKRHTACHVASTHYAVLVRGTLPVLGPDLDKGYPIPTPGTGFPLALENLEK